MIRKTALAATIAALLNPVVVGALGLGNIEVSSALNEPLKARIPLRGVSSEDVDELKAALGTREQFSRAGLDRGYILSNLRFKIVQAGGTRGHIEVTTRDPVSEPFLNFLVDVNWRNGRVLREYTVLLDPPVYGAAIRSATARTTKTVTSLPAAAPQSAPTAAPAMAAPAASSTSGVMPMSAAPSGVSGDSYGAVRDGETLWSIADKTRPGDVSIQSMMLALLRANPQAFSINNVNALKTGAVLRIPTASEIRDDRAQALSEVARQHGLWDEYRQSIAVSAQPQPGAESAQLTPSQATRTAESAAMGESAAADSSTTDSASAELRLVGAGTTGTSTGGGSGSEVDIQALRDELSMAQEDAEAAKLENEELKSRLGEVEGLVDDMKRLVELREEQLAALQNQLAQAGQTSVTDAAKPVETAPPVVETSEQAATMEPAHGEAEPAHGEAEPAHGEAEPEHGKAEPGHGAETEGDRHDEPHAGGDDHHAPVKSSSLLDDIQAMLPVPLWTILAGLGTLLLGFGGLRMSRARTVARNSETAFSDDVAAPVIDEGGSLIEQYARTELPDDGQDDVTEMPVTPSPDALAGDDDKTEVPQTSTAALEAGTDTGVGDEDPLAEVNVYLAYERFDQAEQLVRDAIETYPQRPQYRLKLLEVFYAAKNVASFAAAAEGLQAAVGADDEMLTQARDWWDELGTGSPFPTDDAGPSTTQHSNASAADASSDDLFDVGSAETGEQPGVDFDLGFDEPLGDGQESNVDLDFDLGAVDAPASQSDESSLDFDLGAFDDSSSAAGEDSASSKIAGVAAGAAGVAAGVAAAGAFSGVDFDLGDLNIDDLQADDEAKGAADEGGETGLDFNLDGALSDAAGDDATGGALPERAGDSDGNLDFELDGLDDASPSSETGSLVSDDGGLDFTPDDGVASDVSLSADGAGDESALDFDLGGLDDASPASEAETQVSGDSGLDFSLDDGVDSDVSLTDSDSGDESALDFDLGETSAYADVLTDVDDGAKLQADSGASADNEGDEFDLSLDADAGSDDESIDLDLDLGVTGSAGGDELALSAGDGETDELDFDLGDTGSDELALPADDGQTSELGLDFDLGDTGSVGGAELASPAGDGEASEPGLDLELGEADPQDLQGAAPDLGVDSSFQDAKTEISDGSDLDFVLGMDDETSGPDSSDLDSTVPSVAFGDDADSAAFDTVKLSPDAVDSLNGFDADASGEESGFGMDTEFQGIFATDDTDTQSDTRGATDSATASSLDFDLGTALDDIETVDGGEGALDELDQTQFSLRDAPPAIDEDDEDHTLALGRAGSGEVDEMQTKLDLAQAYIDMGDNEGARNLLGEVMAGAGEEQQKQAREMLTRLS